MKVFAAFSVLAVAVVASASSSCTKALTAINSDRNWVEPLFSACNNTLHKKASYHNPWSQKLCVAAAVATTPGYLRDALSCVSPNMPALPDLPFLPFKVYESITGSNNDKVFINQQNLIDLVYSQIQLEPAPVWPATANDVIKYYIQPLFTWVATGKTVPYSHFSDWLRFSPDSTHSAPAHPSSTAVTSKATSTVALNHTSSAKISSTAVFNVTTSVKATSTAVVNATSTFIHQASSTAVFNTTTA